MPTYDYECVKCGNKESVFKKISDPHLEICSRCGENSLIRVINSAPGVEYKGKGWFKTDGKY